jgi:hypothetical protein
MKRERAEIRGGAPKTPLCPGVEEDATHRMNVCESLTEVPTRFDLHVARD